MGKQISNLSVGLFGDVSNFAKAFGKDAVGSVGSFIGSIVKMGSVLGVADLVRTGLEKIGESIADGFGVKEQFEAIDVNAKLSDRLGITTESLAGLQHAASLAGVSNEELTGGFEKMFKSLGQAAGGSKEAVATFDALGLSAADLQNESPDEAFKDIAEKISGITNPAQRAAAAMDIFGKSGQSLLPLLTTGAKGIATAQADAAALGLTFSRLDAHKVEEANDAITRLKGGFTGIQRTVAIALAPFVESGANMLTGWVKTALPFIHYGVATIADLFKGLADWVSGAVGNMYNAIASRWDEIFSVTVAVGVAISEAAQAYWGMLSDVGAVIWEAITEIWSNGCDAIIGQTDNAGNVTTDVFSQIVDAAISFADVMADSFLAIEYSIQHWQDFLELAGVKVALFTVKVASEIGYLLQVADQFASQFSQVAIYMGEEFALVFQNLGDVLSGKVSWDQIWSAMQTSFGKAISRLPGIADRTKSDIEESLEMTDQDLSGQFTEGLDDFITRKRSDFGSIADGLKDKIKKSFNGGGLQLPKLKPSIDPSSLTLGITPEIKKAKALAIGSAEAQALQYGGPQLANYVTAASGVGSPAIPAPVAAPVASGAASASQEADDRTWKQRMLTYALRTEQNTRTAQLAQSTI